MSETITLSSTWPDGTFATATFSADMRHRYLLTVAPPRELLSDETGSVLFVALNPSTATHEVADPTLRRCAGFARRFGFNSFRVCNLFSFRATDPKVMMRADDAEGDPINMQTILRAEAEADIVICAWGALGGLRRRDAEVTRALREQEAVKLRCLGYTSAGLPRHPLMLRADTRLVPFTGLELAYMAVGA